MNRRHSLAVLAAGLAAAAGVQAQAWPARPIRLIVGGEVLPGPTEQFTTLLNSEKARYEKLVREAKIQPD